MILHHKLIQNWITLNVIIYVLCKLEITWLSLGKTKFLCELSPVTILEVGKCVDLD